MSIDLAIVGGLMLGFGITAIAYAIAYHRELGGHQDTKNALEVCRDSHRRARKEADDLQHKAWEHPSELTKAEREGRRKLAEEIRDSEVEAADAAIEALNGRLTALGELHETGAIDDRTFWARDEELRAEIDEQTARISEARQKARSRSGIGWPSIAGAYLL